MSYPINGYCDRFGVFVDGCCVLSYAQNKQWSCCLVPNFVMKFFGYRFNMRARHIRQLLHVQKNDLFCVKGCCSTCFAVVIVFESFL